MKQFILLLALFLTARSFAFTLRSGEPKFPTNDVTIDISGNDCTNAGYTASEIFGIVEKAIDEYWNTVPTSALKLKMGRITGDDLSNTDLTTSFNKAESNHILIGCNAEATVITSANRSSIIAQGTIGVSAGIARGLVLINDFSATPFPGLTERQRLAAMAHEIGHAIGLGHSEYEIALMYYSTGTKIQEHLSIDDFDGISYLYPNEGPVSCGSIASVSSTDKSGASTGWPLLLIGFLLALFIGALIPRPQKL